MKCIITIFQREKQKWNQKFAYTKENFGGKCSGGNKDYQSGNPKKKRIIILMPDTIKCTH